MRTGWLTESARVVRVDEENSGIQASRRIEADELIAAFGGVITLAAQLDSLEEWQRKRSIQVDDTVFLTSLQLDEPGDLINHSCNPNAGLRTSVTLVAMRTIEVGEAITFDYAMSDSVPYDCFECFCGEETCRGTINGTGWQDPVLQERYRGYFSPYLQRRIDAMVRSHAPLRAD